MLYYTDRNINEFVFIRQSFYQHDCVQAKGEEVGLVSKVNEGGVISA